MATVEMPGVVDRHVHLGLVDPVPLRGSSVVEVHDLGWSLEPALAWRRASQGPLIRLAGPFLTPPGGYPKGRVWAPDSAVREIVDREAARAAVGEAVARSLDMVKVVLHGATSPFGPGVLDTIVRGAHDAALPVVAHVEGIGQSELALRSGVDVFAHAPWTERLDDALIGAIARRCIWISTLAIHAGEGRRIAEDNAGRFVAAGGRLRYGTDLGNGDGPVGVRRDEVLALGAIGLSGPALVAVLTGHVGGAVLPQRAVVGVGRMPTDPAGIADWYLAARPAIV
jgi:imidazolonepropionase-like amidohydrolase